MRRQQGGRAARAAVVIGLVAFGSLLGPARPAVAADGESIATYDTHIDVRADGRMRVAETIGYDFAGNDRHGVVRDLPARFRYDDTRDRVYGIDDVSVTMDGQPARVDRSSAGGYVKLKIGDPDRVITGPHTYVIRYTVTGGLNGFDDHDELYWNVVGAEWTVPIVTATATVTGPVPPGQVECSAGPAGSRLGCASRSVAGDTATFSQPGTATRPGLAARSAMSVVVAFPRGSVGDPAPILVDRHDLTTSFRATPVTVGGALGVGIVGVVAALVVAWRVGRDRRYVGQLPGLVPGIGQSTVEERRPMTGAPPVSVEFGPPDRIRPGQVGTLIDERANVLDVTATIIDFAVRRHLSIRELKRGKKGTQDWELTRLTTGDRDFARYERTLFDALFAKGSPVRLSELKNTFATDLAKVRTQLYADMVERGWYRRSPEQTRTIARAAAVGLLVLALAVTAVLALTTQVALIGTGLVVAAVALLIVAGRFPARTGRGSAVLARVQGFRLYLATAEVEQMKFSEREKIFSEFLPYAIVFGLAERWAAIFAAIGSGPTATGAAGAEGISGLYWYTGVAGWSMGSFGQSIGSFTTTTSGTVASTPPSASGSSGFSGGGFSGGGGGGGGGGSW